MLIEKALTLLLVGTLTPILSFGTSSDGDYDTEFYSNADIDLAESTLLQDEADDSSSVKPSDGAIKNLEVVESGYTVDSGYVFYAVGIENPNTEYACDFPTITVTGKDDQGTIVFSDTNTMGEILPGQTLWVASTAGNGTEPATVEFSVDVSSRDWYESSDVDPDIYTISNVNIIDTEYMRNITGEITTNLEWLVYGDPCETAMITAVFKNADGEIVGGACDFEDVGDEGETKAFEIDDYTGIDYETVEVFAYPWL